MKHNVASITDSTLTSTTASASTSNATPTSPLTISPPLPGLNDLDNSHTVQKPTSPKAIKNQVGGSNEDEEREEEFDEEEFDEEEEEEVDEKELAAKRNQARIQPTDDQPSLLSSNASVSTNSSSSSSTLDSVTPSYSSGSSTSDQMSCITASVNSPSHSGASSGSSAAGSVIDNLTDLFLTLPISNTSSLSLDNTSMHSPNLEKSDTTISSSSSPVTTPDSAGSSTTTQISTTTGSPDSSTASSDSSTPNFPVKSDMEQPGSSQKKDDNNILSSFLADLSKEFPILKDNAKLSAALTPTSKSAGSTDAASSSSSPSSSSSFSSSSSSSGHDEDELDKIDTVNKPSLLSSNASVSTNSSSSSSTLDSVTPASVDSPSHSGASSGSSASGSVIDNLTDLFLTLPISNTSSLSLDHTSMHSPNLEKSDTTISSSSSPVTTPDSAGSTDAASSSSSPSSSSSLMDYIIIDSVTPASVDSPSHSSASSGSSAAGSVIDNLTDLFLTLPISNTSSLSLDNTSMHSPNLEKSDTTISSSSSPVTTPDSSSSSTATKISTTTGSPDSSTASSGSSTLDSSFSSSSSLSPSSSSSTSYFSSSSPSSSSSFSSSSSSSGQHIDQDELNNINKVLMDYIISARNLTTFYYSDPNKDAEIDRIINLTHKVIEYCITISNLSLYYRQTLITNYTGHIEGFREFGNPTNTYLNKNNARTDLKIKRNKLEVFFKLENTILDQFASSSSGLGTNPIDKAEAAVQSIKNNRIIGAGTIAAAFIACGANASYLSTVIGGLSIFAGISSGMGAGLAATSVYVLYAGTWAAYKGTLKGWEKPGFKTAAISFVSAVSLVGCVLALTQLTNSYIVFFGITALISPAIIYATTAFTTSIVKNITKVVQYMNTNFDNKMLAIFVGIAAFYAPSAAYCAAALAIPYGLYTLRKGCEGLNKGWTNPSLVWAYTTSILSTSFICAALGVTYYAGSVIAQTPQLTWASSANVFGTVVVGSIATITVLPFVVYGVADSISSTAQRMSYPAIILAGSAISLCDRACTINAAIIKFIPQILTRAFSGIASEDGFTKLVDEGKKETIVSKT